MNPCGILGCEGEVYDLPAEARRLISLWLNMSGIRRPAKAGRCDRCGLGFVLDSASTEESTIIFGMILADGTLVPGDAVARAEEIKLAGGPEDFPCKDSSERWLEAVVREAAKLGILARIPR